MKRISAITFVMLFFIPSGLFAMSRTGAVTVSHPVVAKVTGEVAVRAAGQTRWEKVEKGTLLLEGDVLKTAPGSLAQIKFASGVIELYEMSEVRIPTIGNRLRKKDIRELEVTGGSVLLDLGIDEESGVFNFIAGDIKGCTSNSIITVSNLGKGTTVNLYDGAVELFHDGNGEMRTTSLAPGMSLRVGRNAPARFERFDPLPALKDYNKSVSPELDRAFGFPVRREAGYQGPEFKRTRQDPKSAAGGDVIGRLKPDSAVPLHINGFSVPKGVQL